MLNLRLTTHDRQLKLLIFIVSCLLLVVGQSAVAETFRVEIDTGRETINAVEGSIVLPSGASVGDIYIGNSVVLIWVTNPTLDLEKNTVTFAGITPGGFRGKYPLFLLDIENLNNFTAAKIRGYRNDGTGTEIFIPIRLVQAELEEDTVPPEPFEILISASPDIFDGRHFVSFLAQDKGVGIERYGYKTSWFLSPDDKGWAEIKSPAALSSVEVFKRIHIRATDKTSNQRTVSTSGPYHYVTIIISIIISVCALLFLKRFFPLRS